MGGVSDLVQLKNLRGHVMANAKQEILEHIEGREVEFVKIAVSTGYAAKPLRIDSMRKGRILRGRRIRANQIIKN